MPEAAHAAAILPLCVRGLAFARRGQPLIDAIDLDLEAGGLTAVMGPNGAGKSLLLRLLHGLIEPDAGTVRWNGSPPTPAIRMRQAFVFQKSVLLRRSVLANLDFALARRGLPRARRETLARHWLEVCGLAPLAERPARVLSGGEQQRLALARALALDPEVILLDEPTASLDPASTLAIEGLLAGARTAGRTLLLVTHDIGQARRLADRVVFLYRGRIVEDGPAVAFFAQPTTAPARAYLEQRLVI